MELSTQGVIYLDAPGTRDDLFGHNDLDLVTAVGRHLAFGLERLHLEQQLKASEQHYRLMCQSIIQNSWDSIYRRRLNGTFIMLSPSIKNIWGITAEQMMENLQSWEKTILLEDKRKVLEAYQKVLQGEKYVIQFRIQRGGSEVWIEDTAHPIVDKDGNIECIQGIYKDITNTKLLEQKLSKAQKMEIVGTLAGGVAHDLRNILGGIIGYPELMLEKLPNDSPYRKYLNNIRKSGEQAVSVIDDLNAMSRRANYKMVELELNKAVQDYLDSLTFIGVKKQHPNVDLQLELCNEPLMIKGSPSHLYKVIMNLTNNAMQAMSSGGVLTVKVNKDYIEKDQKNIGAGKYGVLHISDTGCGIAQQDLDKIFDPFYSSKVDSGGTGLGLAVVQGVIEDHGAYINAQSIVGKGTSFSIYFPRLENNFSQPFKENIQKKEIVSALGQ